MISTGSFIGDIFTIATEYPLKDPACWIRLLNNALVVVKPSESFPEGGLLKLSFGALLQLAAVEYPISVDSGLVFMGFSTALVPIKIHNDGQILWHLEVSSDGEPLRISEIQSTKGSWLQRQTLEELQTPEALLGWPASATI